MAHSAVDKYSVSIMAIKAWQDIWSRTFGEMPLRVTMEYLIQSELEWLNQDFKALISRESSVSVKWVAQEEVWKQLILSTKASPETSRLFPIISNKDLDLQQISKSHDELVLSSEHEEEIYKLQVQLEQMKQSFKKESSDLHLKIKAKDEQLRSANDYLELLTAERETDRNEIETLTRNLAQERKWRDNEIKAKDDLRLQNNALQVQAEQVALRVQDLGSELEHKDKLIASQASEIAELQSEKSVSPSVASKGINTDQVESKVDDSEELVEYIKELHQQLKCKDDQIESIKEEIRCKKIWYKEEKKTLLHKVNTASIDQEIDMATNNESASAANSHVDDASSLKQQAKVTFDDLASQERRTRIAFLENQQAELETEIRLLKQNVDVSNLPSIGASEAVFEKRQPSSGLGDSSIESNPELDALSKMVVDKVLERIKTQQQAENSLKMHQNQPNAPPPPPPSCDDKTGMAVNQMRHLLQRERNLVSELQAAISTERLKVLEWMQRHNREKETIRELKVEICDTRSEMEVMHQQHLKDREEIDQLTNLYKAEQAQANILESALVNEKDNFHRLKVALDTERIRSREAIDRDNDTILDLRTALEVERERWRSSSQRGGGQFLMPSASVGNIPGRFRSLQESYGSRTSKQLAVQMSVDEINHLRATIDQLRNELHEERNRVDALKACLEQERDKYNKLSASIVEQQPPSIQESTAAAATKNTQQNQLDQEVIVYYARKLETEQLQKMQLQNQMERAQDQISRLESDKEFLRAQLKLQDSPNANFEKFYIDELEKKLEAHRMHESKLAGDLQVAQSLLKDLQDENKGFLEREKEMVNQLERLQDQKIDLATNTSNESPSKLSHANAINEALQGKIRLLENRIARLQDEVETANLLNAGQGMAIMMKSNKKSKDGSKPTMKLRIWRLERQKKCLVWQKKYLQAVLANVEDEQQQHCNCNLSSSESHSMPSNAEVRSSVTETTTSTTLEATKKKRPSFKVVGHAVIAVIRLQGCAESWRKMVSKSSSSKSVTPLSDKL